MEMEEAMAVTVVWAAAVENLEEEEEMEDEPTDTHYKILEYSKCKLQHAQLQRIQYLHLPQKE